MHHPASLLLLIFGGFISLTCLYAIFEVWRCGVKEDRIPWTVMLLILFVLCLSKMSKEYADWQSSPPSIKK